MRIQTLIILVIAFLCSSCTKTQSIRVQNETDEALEMRVSVDVPMDAYQCKSTAHVGTFNREGLFTVEPGKGICLISEVPKGEDSFDIRERIQNITLVRQSERCMYMTTDELMEHYEESAGRHLLEVQNGICPPVERLQD